jgi:O-antigen/teichoic acid export membrane protein
MPTLIRSLTTSSVERLLGHWREPLYRNGYALVINSAGTSGFGFLYWILAAHYYSAEVVGLNSAVVASIMFMANISQLNLIDALIRFIPKAGQATNRLVIYAYVVSAALSFITSFIFVIGVDLWSPELAFLGSSPLFTLWFMLSVMAWCIWMLQESTLTGLRKASWVPLQNSAFASLRLVLVVTLAAALPQLGIFASWVIPLICLLPLISMLLFGRLIPSHVQATEDRATRILPSQMIRYVGANYFASVIRMTTISLLPLMILAQAGPVANAYFFLPWTICSALYLVSQNMGMSLIAEAANEEEKLTEYSFGTLVQTAGLLLPVVALIVLGAPYILGLFGEGYADEGTMLLRLLALSAIPHMGISLYISRARVLRRMRRVFWAFAFESSLGLALSFILLDEYGITGVGIGWLLTEAVVVGTLLLTQLRSAWFCHLNMYVLLHGLRRHWNRQRHWDSIPKFIPTILSTVPAINYAPPPITWQPKHVISNTSEVTLIILGPIAGPPVAVLKLPQTDYAAVGLRQQSAVLSELHANQQLGHFRALLPTLLAEGKISGQPYFVEMMLPGRDAVRVLFDATACRQFHAAAASAIREFHRCTASSVIVDEGLLLQRWVDEPLCMVEHITGTHGQNQRNRKAIRRVSDELHKALAGRTLTLSWIHGNFTPGNILVTPDGTSVTGIIDWDHSAQKELPQLDLALLLLSTRVLVQRRELGDVIRDLLKSDRWEPHEQTLLDEAYSASPSDSIEMRPLVLLTWLRHVASNLSKSSYYVKHRLWINKNINGVLRYI